MSARVLALVAALLACVAIGIAVALAGETRALEVRQDRVVTWPGGSWHAVAPADLAGVSWSSTSTAIIR